MEIIWHGLSYFTVKLKKMRIVIDPYSDVGLKLSAKKADVILISQPNILYNNIAKVTPTDPNQKLFIIDNPGEYEIKGVFIEGIGTKHRAENGDKQITNTIYVIRDEEISLCHLGGIDRILKDEQLELLNGIDILLIPIGGKFTINASAASEIMNQIEAKIIIPMHYQIPGLNLDLANLDDFCKQEGISPSQTQELLKITKADLPQEESKIILLQPR